jgi:hypothetical protein
LDFSVSLRPASCGFFRVGKESVIKKTLHIRTKWKKKITSFSMGISVVFLLLKATDSLVRTGTTGVGILFQETGKQILKTKKIVVRCVLETFLFVVSTILFKL